MGGKMSKEYHRDYYRKNLAATPLWTGERRDTPKAIIYPTISNLHWAAGFMEGEGSFRQFNKTGNSSGVEATNCDLEPLYKLQQFFGGRIRKKAMGPRNRQQPYSWAAYGVRARGIILTLYMLMSEKRKRQCRIALQGKFSK